MHARSNSAVQDAHSGLTVMIGEAHSRPSRLCVLFCFAGVRLQADGG